MEQLVGRSGHGPFRVAGMIVALVAVFGLVRLITSGTGHETRTERLGATATVPSWSGSPRTPAGSAAHLSPASLPLPAAPCGDVAELQLHGPLVQLDAASQRPDPLADLFLTECGGAGGVVITPGGDALLGQADVSAAAGYTECAESMREGTVSRLVVGVGTTFCALQRSGTVDRVGGKTMARVTLTGPEASGAFIVAIQGWPV